MGSALALKENRPLVPNTPTHKAALVSELRDLYANLQVESVLMGMSEIVRMVGEVSSDTADSYLLLLNA